MTQNPARDDPDPHGNVIPIGLGYRPAATPGAPGLPKLLDQDDQVLTGEVVDAEPVDRPDVAADTGTWLDQRRAYLDHAPDVIPSYLRDTEEFTRAARLAAAYYAHFMAFHATRSPVYLLRLVARSPRGAARLLARWGRWVTDAESRPLIREAAGRELNVNLGDGVVRHSGGDAQRYMMLTMRHDQRVKGRTTVTAVVAVPVGVLLVAAALTLPTWAVGAGITGVLALLGVAGRQQDRPIISHYVSVQLQRPVTSEEITGALAAIGVKGKPHFVAPIQTDGPGWRAELDLPPGVLAETVLEKRKELAGAMRRPLATVWPETDTDAHPGRCVLWVAKQDPAKARRRLWPLLKDGRADMFGEFPFGFDPRGRAVHLNLMYTNLLIGGVPGSGKTSAVLVIALAAALDPYCELWVYELKGSGDLESVRPVCHRYVSGDDDDDCAAALDALRALEREMKRRKDVIRDLPIEDVPKGRKVYPHLAKRKELGLYPLVAIFDECHTLFEHEEYGKEAAEIAGRLIRKARAYGIILVVTTQKPDAKSLPTVVSGNVSTRFCLAVVGQQANDMVLGTSMYRNGIRATMFDPRKEAGTGWLSRSAHDNQIVRAAFLTQDEAMEVGRRALAMRRAAGTLSGQAAGEAVDPVDTTTIIDHLREVWPDGADRVHSHRLVDALAAYRPDLYGAWLDEADGAARSALLSAALRPHRVRTVQLTIRDCCGGAKGVRWDDLPDAVEDADGDGG